MYNIYGKIKTSENTIREELLDTTSNKRNAIDRIKTLRYMKYFRKWSLWYEEF